MSLRTVPAFAFGLLFLSTSAFAATTDSLGLGGEVVSTLAVDCTDTAGAMTLDLDGGASVIIVKVSDCDATTNDDSGLTITYTPSGPMVGDEADVFAFAVKSVVEAASAPVAGDFGANAAANQFETAASGAAPNDVYIKVTQNVNADPGDYTASIAVTTADNS